MAQERRVPQVAGRDLVGGQVELREQVGARLVERGREEDQPDLVREGAELRERTPVELERLAVPAVRGTEAVLVVVRASYSARVKSERLSRFWSLTALTPTSFAAWNSATACSTLPWWLWPISAMTKHGVSSAIRRPSMVSSRIARWYPSSRLARPSRSVAWSG